MATNAAPPAGRSDGPPPAPAGKPRRIVKDRGPLWRHVLGDQLRALRHGRGETLTETADRARVSPQYLSEMERGIKEPSSEMIAAVAGALDVTLIDLALGVAESLRSSQGSGARDATCRATYALAA